MTNVNHTRKRSDKGVRRKLSVSAIKREAVKHPLLTSKQLFEQAGVGEVPRTSRCHIHQTVAKNVKPNIRPPLNSRHKAKRVEWARQYMKVDFQTVLFTDECRATLDGPNGWCRGGLLMAPPTNKGKTAARRRRCYVLGRIDWQGGCWAIQGTRRAKNECPIIYTVFERKLTPLVSKTTPSSIQKEDHIHAGQRTIPCCVLYHRFPGKTWFQRGQVHDMATCITRS